MFDSHATATEFLDRPDCDPALAAAGDRSMEMINRRFGGMRIVRRFLASEIAGRHTRLPLRILDIGSGSCDIPLTANLPLEEASRTEQNRGSEENSQPTPAGWWRGKWRPYGSAFQQTTADA